MCVWHVYEGKRLLQRRSVSSYLFISSTRIFYDFFFAQPTQISCARTRGGYVLNSIAKILQNYCKTIEKKIFKLKLDFNI